MQHMKIYEYMHACRVAMHILRNSMLSFIHVHVCPGHGLPEDGCSCGFVYVRGCVNISPLLQVNTLCRVGGCCAILCWLCTNTVLRCL